MVDLNISLPESFFNEEKRCGYLVSSETKKLWAVELDLLNEFDRVCKKYGLRYILDFGSLLGAIRHKGFIPWDDDIDVSMLREDFDKLMEIGPSEFKSPYFFQNQHTEDHFDMEVTRLRRSDTASINKNDIVYGNMYNQGIFLDIDVFDYVPTLDTNAMEDVHERCREYCRAIYSLSHYRPSFKRRIKPTIINTLLYLSNRLRYGSLEKVFQRLDEESTQFKRSEYVCCLHSNFGTWCRNRQVYVDTIDVPFENLMLPVPASYHEVLTQRYGDYMIPVNEYRDFVLYVDTDHSYKDIINDDVQFEKICDELSINLKDYHLSLFDYLKLKLKMK